MEKNKLEDEPLYTKISPSLKDRMVLYTTESKLSGKKDTDSIKKLIEISVDNYMIHNPISAKQNTQG